MSDSTADNTTDNPYDWGLSDEAVVDFTEGVLVEDPVSHPKIIGRPVLTGQVPISGNKHASPASCEVCTDATSCCPEHGTHTSPHRGCPLR